MKQILFVYGLSFLLTLVLEFPVCYLLGMRSRKQLELVFLVNLLTNPAAVLLCWLGVAQIPVEIGVFLVEAGVYYWFSRDESWNIKHPVLLALVANLVSWGSGILIQMGGRI